MHSSLSDCSNTTFVLRPHHIRDLYTSSVDFSGEFYRYTRTDDKKKSPAFYLPSRFLPRSLPLFHFPSPPSLRRYLPLLRVASSVQQPSVLPGCVRFPPIGLTLTRPETIKQNRIAPFYGVKGHPADGRYIWYQGIPQQEKAALSTHKAPTTADDSSPHRDTR